MKLNILLLAAAALPGFIHGVCHAQSPVQEVIDNALIQQTMSSTQDILGVLQQQLTEAQKQTQSLTDQLSRMGDPAAVSLPALQLIKDDIAKSVENASNGAAREDRIRATTGSEAFGDNAYGLVEGVGPTVTLEDGTTVNRDPEEYKIYAALAEDLNELAEQSRETDERITQLQQQRGPILEQVSTATDLATVAKLQVGLQAIDAQIANSNAELIRKKQDFDILTEKLRVQGQILAKSKAETAKLENQNLSTTSSSTPSARSPAGTTPFSGLRWGKSSSGTTTEE